ncbi:hypothetical protein CFC21_036449, partial [Triticum aestivum]
VGVGVGVVLL